MMIKKFIVGKYYKRNGHTSTTPSWIGIMIDGFAEHPIQKCVSIGTQHDTYGDARFEYIGGSWNYAYNDLDDIPPTQIRNTKYFKKIHKIISEDNHNINTPESSIDAKNCGGGTK